MTCSDFLSTNVRRLGLAVMALLLAGCMLARSADPVTVVAPQVATAVDADRPEVSWTLLIQRPQAGRMLDSDRILVRVAGSQLQPYPGAVWLDDLPDMVQALMIQVFEDSGRFAAVARSGSIRAPFSLATEVRRFEAVDDGDRRLDVELSIRARLIHHASGRVVDSRTFGQRLTVEGRGFELLVESFEAGMSQVFSDIAGWSIEQGEAFAAD
ncbi:MAG: ABC-type transport auxiliary lipoprotein family protein [Wenzhouxiangella sp.]